MQLQQRVDILVSLGKYLKSHSPQELDDIAEKAAYYNPWFTKNNVLFSMEGVAKFLTKESLEKLSGNYTFSENDKTVGIIMAGNIPLVGFHDLLSVLLAGHKAMIKLSSKDEVLPKFFLELLEEVSPEMAAKVSIVDKLENFDAIIATGSNNTSRYFEYYFSKYPHIIRKNRTSVAILTGDESADELQALSDDILLYFGMGCRNVSKVLVPVGYDFVPLFEALTKYEDVSNHNKYLNNYEYYKSIYLINGDKFFDTGFIMFKEDLNMASPISVVYYQYYSGLKEAQEWLNEKQEEIQVVVASHKAIIEGAVPFGKAQLPEIDDFADGVDTMKFLTQLK